MSNSNADPVANGRVRFRALWDKWRLYEPARLKAAYAAVIALALVFGRTLPGETDARVTAILGVLAVVLPAVQAELTRRNVVPVARVLGRGVAREVEEMEHYIESAGRHVEGVPVADVMARARAAATAVHDLSAERHDSLRDIRDLLVR